MKYLWGLSTLRQQTVACHCAILGSDVLEVFCGSSGSSDLKKRNETSWKHHQERTLRVGPLRSVSPLIAFTGSWRATTKPPHLYSNLLFSLFLCVIASWSKWTCFSSCSLMFYQTENLTAHLLVTQDGLWQWDQDTVCLIKRFVMVVVVVEGGSVCVLQKSFAFSLIMLTRNQPYVDYSCTLDVQCVFGFFFRICLRSWYFFPCTCCDEILLHNVYLMQFSIKKKTLFQKSETKLKLKQLQETKDYFWKCVTYLLY